MSREDDEEKGQQMIQLRGFYSIIDYTVPTSEGVTTVAEAFAKVKVKWVARYDGFVRARFLADTEEPSVRTIVE